MIWTLVYFWLRVIIAELSREAQLFVVVLRYLVWFDRGA